MEQCLHDSQSTASDLIDAESLLSWGLGVQIRKLGDQLPEI